MPGLRAAMAPRWIVLIIICLAGAVSSHAQTPTPQPIVGQGRNIFRPDWTGVTHEPFELIPAVPDNPVLTAADVTDADADLVADPFMFYEDGIWYMFFEAWTSSPPGGKICLATSTDGLSWTYDRIVLNDGTHHSFPCVFKYGGEHYMIPESSEQGRVALYRAADFPYDWQYVATLITRRNLVDPSIFRFNGRWWMFVGLSGSTNCYLYYSNQLTTGWHHHPMSPIVENDKSRARPAGRTIVFDGDRVIRLAQKGDHSYGEAVRAFEVDTLTPVSYHETEIPESPILEASGEGWNATGMHTCDPWWVGDHWLAAVDGIDELWSIGIYRTGSIAGMGPTVGATALPTIRLDPGSPNPFDRVTSFRFGLDPSPTPRVARFTVYDAMGREILAFADPPAGSTTGSILWRGTGQDGRRLPSGSYFLRMRSGTEQLTRRVVIAR